MTDKLYIMKARNFAMTIPANRWSWPEALPDKSIRYLKGQLEKGEKTGYEHWQLHINFYETTTGEKVSKIFGKFNIIPLKNEQIYAHLNYVCKDDTRLLGPFEMGIIPHRGGDRRSTKFNLNRNANKVSDNEKRTSSPKHRSGLEILEKEQFESTASRELRRLLRYEDIIFKDIGKGISIPRIAPPC